MSQRAILPWVVMGCVVLGSGAGDAVAAPQETQTHAQPTNASSADAPGAPDATQAPAASAPVSERDVGTLDATAAPDTYTVQPEDILQITVYQEPDLTTKARVLSNGEITFPLLGRVTVTGLTVTQVQEQLTRLLGEDYLVQPQVQVFIETYRPRNVFITGSVNRPGSYPIPTEQPTTLMEAIAMAGGFSEQASLNGTRIIRIEQGQEQIIRVKVNDIISKGDKTRDVRVYPNDLIFVPESFF